MPEGEDLQSHMHITPCRASRALALRFLALKNELTMADMTVVCLPARVTHQDEDKIRVTGHTSDLSELISGLCRVRPWRANLHGSVCGCMLHAALGWGVWRGLISPAPGL